MKHSMKKLHKKLGRELSEWYEKILVIDDDEQYYKELEEWDKEYKRWETIGNQLQKTSLKKEAILDAFVTIGGLVGICLFERFDNIRTKAWGFISKGFGMKRY